jgi:hypothetical protein
MIRERLELRRELPSGALPLLALGLVVVAAAWAFNLRPLLIAAALPVAVGGALCLLAHEAPFTAALAENGLEMERGADRKLIPYASIQDVKAGGRPIDPERFCAQACDITILHEQGLDRIPARLNFPSHQVYRCLAERLPDRGGRDVNAVLTEYLERETKRFGPERVASFCALRGRITSVSRAYRAILIGVTLAGAAWVAAGFSGFAESAWGGVGILCIIVGGGLFATTFSEPADELLKRKWRNASLVVSPRGMAMVQGDLEGELLWQEVLDVRFRPGPPGVPALFAILLPGVFLRVRGAWIFIADVYDRPLLVIYNGILAHRTASKNRRPDDVRGSAGADE